MRSRTTCLVATLAVALAATACGGDAETAADETPATTSATTTTSTTLVPDEITVEYVQGVVDELDESFAAMIRRFRDDGGPTPDTEQWMEHLFAGGTVESIRLVVQKSAEVEFANIRDDVGPPETLVEEVVTGRSTCIFFKGTRSYEPVLRREIASPMTEGYVALQPAEPGRVDPAGAELPPWRIAFEGRTETGAPPDDPCD